MKDLIHRIPCSVSQELIDWVVEETGDFFIIKGGEDNKEDKRVNIGRVLFHLGFKIDTTLKSFGYYITENVWVRDNNMPSLLYKTDKVYNGEVRDMTYTTVKRKHPMASLYEKYEVLQPPSLEPFIEEFTNILDIGDPTEYDKAFC